MIKRLFDLLSAASGLIFLSPILLACALAILITDGRPVLFRQTRVGLHQKPFTILKFRTMRNAPFGNGSAITSLADDRITPVGQFLRRTKLDELPQLINVVLGHMSMVGPRPEVPHLFAQYPSSLQSCMAALRPGITDYASILFSDENSQIADNEDPERYYLDKIIPKKAILIEKYAAEISFATDLKIISLTLRKILTT